MYAHITAVTEAENKLEFEHTWETPLLALMGKQWGVFLWRSLGKLTVLTWHCTVILTYIYTWNRYHHDVVISHGLTNLGSSLAQVIDSSKASTKQLLVLLLADWKESKEHATGNWMKTILRTEKPKSYKKCKRRFSSPEKYIFRVNMVLKRTWRKVLIKFWKTLVHSFSNFCYNHDSGWVKLYSCPSNKNQYQYGWWPGPLLLTWFNQPLHTSIIKCGMKLLNHPQTSMV